MKKLKIKWLEWTGKVLSSIVAMLGMSSCFFQPCMYGVPDLNWKPDSAGIDSLTSDSLKSDTSKMVEFEGMYSVRPARYQQMIEKDGMDIEIQQK
ncbi:MAG: hypothetical protein J5616_07225 [Bacteroidaceae bacterium]|nr:hypothetical protein [Bacteroidaceae bacterium]